jgi:hypothetical protein
MTIFYIMKTICKVIIEHIVYDIYGNKRNKIEITKLIYSMERAHLIIKI